MMKNRSFQIFLGTLWIASVALGLGWLWRDSQNAVEGVPAAKAWPGGTLMQLAADRPTLVLIAHPKCPCTAASIGELNHILAFAKTKPRTYVVFVRPDGFKDEDLRGANWRSAAHLPGVEIVVSEGDREARLFGANTSGHTFLFDASGRRVFSGGITLARGHSGDNPGAEAMLSFLEKGKAGISETPIFGCWLLNPDPLGQNEARGGRA